ncbi:MAG TPA: PspA/IM30 family protein [Noviherbaspirillum sp.]|jgi:phage shock protein A|uniref:PspA/IM30 family protein n=1 Tax=Noviherbaspirillum sp. TaxID=1926288 RepID=UPI002DDCAFBE|nr:PspA/IM30 family protein [Noviherbaspirillum sp.]HEV2611198.1 PspA/IM30 family protein [Noviherbaspirillum sp.]
MADSLRNRVSQIVVGSVHALLDKVEDQAPEAMMEQAIRKVETVIDEVRQELGVVAANRHLAQRHHAELNRRHLELTTSAEEAINLRREDLARAAVAKQLDTESQMPVVEGTLQDLGKQEKELSGYVDALMSKKREMQEQLSSFRASRARAASATGATVATNSSLHKVDDASAAFGKIFERHTGISTGMHKLSVEQASKLKELDDLVQNKRIEERLAQLKADTASKT